MDCDPLRVQPGAEVDLGERPTLPPPSYVGGKAEAKLELDVLNERLSVLQQRLYANGKHKLLVMFQGMDTSGKDSTIRHVFAQINPMGVTAVAFGRPSEKELAHDYLWRAHRHTPGDGTIAIFNRSHYEDVLIVRVQKMVPLEMVEKRYGHIVAWEQMLADEGTVIRKFFLHISPEEQRERLQERVDNPEKRWKFEHGDIEQRKYWDDYQRAYELALARTSTDAAPWYVVPADKKWFRNLVVSQVIIDALEAMDLRPPQPPDVEGLVIT